MNVADRIIGLRKAKGVSQEELADIIGVSRQSVSKWESEQSIPDIDKVIIMSDYFEVSTDYILKGIENEKQANEKAVNANIFVIVATFLNFVGLIVALAVWFEEQNAIAIVVGLVPMAAGCMIFGVGSLLFSQNTQASAKRNFWMVNIWLLSFIPLSCLHNILAQGFVAPYPLPPGLIIAYIGFWAGYLALCLAVTLTQSKRTKARH